MSAFTTGDGAADSGQSPYINMELASGEEGRVRLYNRPGNDFEKNKGDFWDFSMESFGFDEPCITNVSIVHVEIENDGSGDGWQMETILTTIRSGDEHDLLTADYYIDKWLDADDISQHKVDLTIV